MSVAPPRIFGASRRWRELAASDCIKATWKEANTPLRHQWAVFQAMRITPSQPKGGAIDFNSQSIIRSQTPKPFGENARRRCVDDFAVFSCPVLAGRSKKLYEGLGQFCVTIGRADANDGLPSFRRRRGPRMVAPKMVQAVNVIFSLLAMATPSGTTEI